MNLISALCRIIEKCTRFRARFRMECGTGAAQGPTGNVRAQADTPDWDTIRATRMPEHEWDEFIAHTLANTPDDWGRADKKLLEEIEHATSNQAIL